MTTCRDLVKTALRKCAVIQAGRDPSSAQAADGLAALQGLYDGWINGGAFGRLSEVIAAANMTAAEQTRILNTTYTITLPTSVTDALTGDVRPPYDLALVEVVKAATARQISVYDAQGAGWVRLDGLTLSSAPPLASRGTDGLASCLARLLAEEYGAELGPLTLASAARFESALSRKANAPERPLELAFF